MVLPSIPRDHHRVHAHWSFLLRSVSDLTFLPNQKTGKAFFETLQNGGDR